MLTLCSAPGQDVQYRIAAFWSDRDTRDITGGRNIAEFMDWAEAEDPVVSLAQEVYKSARRLVLCPSAARRTRSEFVARHIRDGDDNETMVIATVVECCLRLR
eukprot:COSAG06_NODE_668_length_13234_cov_75.848268_6_plen_103_part_00